VSLTVISQTAEIDGRPVQYTIRRSKRARYPHVKVCRQRGIMITVPWGFTPEDYPLLVDHWGGWMVEHADRMGVRLGPTVNNYEAGSTVNILAEPCLIETVPILRGTRKSFVERSGHTLRVNLKPRDVGDVRGVLEKYLRQLALQDICARIEKWAPLVGAQPTRVRVRNQSTRWGSCSRAGVLNFCFRLVMGSPRAIDAIVVHELCHLIVWHHSRAFYDLVESVYPGYQKDYLWLRDHAQDLAF